MRLFFSHLTCLHQMDLGARYDPDLTQVLSKARQLFVFVVYDCADPQHKGRRFRQDLALERHGDDKDLLIPALISDLFVGFLAHQEYRHQLRVSLRHIDDPFHAGPVAERHDGDQKIRRRLRSHA